MDVFNSVFIVFYKVTGIPLLDYFLGTFLLAFLSVLVGEITISLVFRANKSHFDRLNSRYEKMKYLSEEAIRLGDESSYKAVNKEGNDVFGRLFFSEFGLSAASLWPIFFALEWMQQRFSDILLPLPFFEWGISYVVFFVLCYIPTRILFGRLKTRLPYFKGIQKILQSYDQKPLNQDENGLP